MAASSAPATFSLVALSLVWTIVVPGCALAPRTRVEEAHKLVQALRAENAQMKDTTLTLRAQNQELAQRAVDDSRAIRALEVAADQYEQSIQGYQDEREKMRTAFRDVERMARGGTPSSRSAANPASDPDPDLSRFHALARSIPGASFDDDSRVLSVPAEALFPSGGSRPTVAGNSWIDELAVQVAASSPDRFDLRLLNSTDDAEVRRTSLGSGDDQARVLGQKRAQFVREAVAARARLDVSRVAVSVQALP